MAGKAVRDRVDSSFDSSPDSVTPCHFDIEPSLLMQVSGPKTVSFGRSESELARRHEVEAVLVRLASEDRVPRRKLAAYGLTPGRGMYIPPVAPHWVHNGPAMSLSVTSYFTAATERENMIEAFNGRLRSFHLTPRQPGSVRSLSTSPKWLPCEPRDFSGACARDRRPEVSRETGVALSIGTARERVEPRVVVLVNVSDRGLDICQELAVSRGELGS